MTIEWEPVSGANGYELFVFYEDLIPNVPGRHPLDSSFAAYRAYVWQRPSDPDNPYWTTASNTLARKWTVAALCQHGAGGILIVPTNNGAAVSGDQDQQLSFLPNVQTSIDKAVWRERSARESADVAEKSARQAADASLSTGIEHLTSLPDRGARIVRRRVKIVQGTQPIEYVAQTASGPVYLIPSNASLRAVWYAFVEPVNVPSLATIDIKASGKTTVVVECTVIPGTAFPVFTIDVFAAWDYDSALGT